MASEIAERAAHGSRWVIEAFRQPAGDRSVVRQPYSAIGQRAELLLLELFDNRPGVSVVELRK